MAASVPMMGESQVFPGSLVWLGNAAAIAEGNNAARYSRDLATGRQKWALYADSSRKAEEPYADMGGCAVVYRPPGYVQGPWLVRAWRVPDMAEILHGELYGIVGALLVVLEYAEQGLIWDTAINVFNDNLECQHWIRGGPGNKDLDPVIKPLVQAVSWISRRLGAFRCEVTMSWIPGHRHNVVPHIIADGWSRNMWTGRPGVTGYVKEIDWVFDGSIFEGSLAACLQFKPKAVISGPPGVPARSECRASRSAPPPSPRTEPPPPPPIPEGMPPPPDDNTAKYQRVA
ncbi:hypothetical protein QBC34DRAFT_424171 [Podospora aff. communis PSN243]|uniref:RNase H type-1 domain-containing protein n=1 Tax=Podospora aff. communis PSN243 TaxID=3040156 RepID=A0AAV9GVE2_9PEZI|nr:hypothetical protein QBC34DRAFT_424171 [Podospora aff. communis PSN243]